MKIKIIKTNNSLFEGETLELKQVDEMLWQSSTGLTIVDTWQELSTITEYFNETNCRVYFDLHLFVNAEKLTFIEEIEYVMN